MFNLYVVHLNSYKLNLLRYSDVKKKNAFNVIGDDKHRCPHVRLSLYLLKSILYIVLIYD